MTKDNLSPAVGNIEANYPSSTPTPTINTPPSGDSSPRSRSRPQSRKSSPFRTSSAHSSSHSPALNDRKISSGEEDVDLADEEMAERDLRSPLHRPTDGRSHVPLLKDEGGRQSYDGPNGSARPGTGVRRSTFQSISPDTEGSAATKKKYTIAAFFLALSLVTFVIQTETAEYIQHELGWKKAYAML
ncbi:MAG: hypothetical protein Q9191_006006 [Dirinaria sp. TL-2023a]